MMTLLVVGGILLENSMSRKEQLEDCSCVAVASTQIRQQEAGMFGWGKCKNGVQKKKFMFITVDRRGCCSTYSQ
ncbi:MAG: hypothetical protein GDA42_03690 [Ekhidna sp.]|nr:hypothetical protein [Ekhidna sp.]MBC6409548.1 hypothetical protein [Ekhidna sp.]